MVDHQLAFLLDHFPEVAEYSARRTRINRALAQEEHVSGVLLLNVFDVARSLGAKPLEATATSVANWLLTEYVPKRGGSFNYNPAINATFDLFRGASSAEQAALYCLSNGNPKGRAQNADAVRCIAKYAVSNISRCYRIGFTAVAVGRAAGQTIYIGIKAPMVRVLNDDVFVVMPGFRMGYRPEEAEIDVACSIGLANFARDDFRTADFEYLYAGPGQEGGRSFRSIKGRERNVYSRDAVDALLSTYVEGIALVLSAGMADSRPSLRGYSVISDAQQRLV